MTKESVKGHFAVHKLPSSEPMGLYSAYENSPTPFSFQPQHQQPETPAPASSTLPSSKAGNHKTKMW